VLKFSAKSGINGIVFPWIPHGKCGIYIGILANFQKVELMESNSIFFFTHKSQHIFLELIVESLEFYSNVLELDSTNSTIDSKSLKCMSINIYFWNQF
jgi:hypothetical protein